MNALGHDLRFALRGLRRSPGFATLAVFTLALGIGATTAIFSVVDALMIRPLPYHDPDRLVMVWENAEAIGFPRNTPAPGNYFSWKDLNRTLSDLAATRSASANLTTDGAPEFVSGRRVTANFFSVLGVPPMLGRTFTEEEDRTGALVTVISYGLWQRRYAGDPDIIGRTIVMNGERRTIIGVMPRPFVFRDRERDFWNPIQFTPEMMEVRSSHFLNVVGRLAPGATLAEARADLEVITARLEKEYAANDGVGVVVESMKTDLLGDTSVQLLVLLGAAVGVLLIACANVAGLLLMRAVNRRGELAVRVSLGATSSRLVRYLAAEALLLSTAGGVLGLALAPLGASVLADLVPAGMLPLETQPIDLRLAISAAGLALVTALAVSLGPGVHMARRSIIEGLQQMGRSRLDGSPVLRDLLVVGQVALAIVLLVGTGLLLRTLSNLRGIDIGFRPQQVLTLRTTLPPAKYPDHLKRLAFYERVLDEVRGMPGVSSAAYTSIPPFGSIGNTAGVTVDGRPTEQDALVRVGTNDYLKTIGAELVEGRFLDARDQPGTPLVVVVNELFASVHLPDRSAIGHQVALGDPKPLRTIVGVVKDVRERGYAIAMKPAVYVPASQVAFNFFNPETLVVRASGDLTALVQPIRRAVAQIDPEQPVTNVRTLQEILDLDVVDRRQQITLLGLFAGLAVLLAAVGLYGLLAYVVTQRTREIGIRSALGAQRGELRAMFIRHGITLAAVGVTIGVAGSAMLTRLMSSLLVGVSPFDPTTYVGGSLVLLTVAVFASYIPARRAARVDPLVALRYE